MVKGDQLHIERVVKALNEGTEQYQQVASLDISQSAKDVIACIIKARTFASAFLNDLLTQKDLSPLSNHAFGSVLHKLYPDMLNRLPEDFSAPELDALNQVEQHTQTIMLKALRKIQDPLIKSVLMDLNPRLNRPARLHSPFDQAC